MEQQPLMVLEGALLGLLPTLLTLFFSWLERRTLVEKQNRILSLAKQRVEFLTSWAKAQEPLCTSERYQEIQKTVSHDLDQILEGVREVMVEKNIAKKPQRNFLQRWFLVYQPRTVAAWVYHTIFYMLAGAFFLWWLDVPLLPQKYFGTGGIFVGLIIVTFPLGVMALLVRLLAVREERKMEEERIVARSTKKENAQAA